jgi:hypothetical protein
VRRLGLTLSILALTLFGSDTHAKPVAPDAFCSVYSDSPSCAGQLDCSYCHVSTDPVFWNPYGQSVREALQGGGLSNEEFLTQLPDALAAVELLDSDGDDYTNKEEIDAGALPGNAASAPFDLECPEDVTELDYPICQISPRHVFRKVHLDFCGASPSYAELKDFIALDEEAQTSALHNALDGCLDSEHWLGKDGQLWRMAHPKVRPIAAIKAGEDSIDESIVQLSDYYHDYQLFVYTQIDDHDLREVLTAKYFVERTDNPTIYTTTDEIDLGKYNPPCGNRCLEKVDPPYRAGMLTTNWYLLYFTMFTAVPRTAAAQAYRAYLGYDIARSEGLNPVAGEPVDYDSKGVNEPECAACHSTLDPITYAFRNYNGIFPGLPQSDYVSAPADRLAVMAPNDPLLQSMPASGTLLGEPYNELVGWVQVAANSDDFVIASTRDYWRLLIGRDPFPNEQAEFSALWTDLRGKHNYSVEKMLHDLIMTEAYGAP